MIKTLITLLSLTFILHSIGQNSILQTNKIEIDSILKTEYLTRILPLDDFCLFVDSEKDTIKSFIDIHSKNFSFFSVNKQDTVIIFDGKLCGGHESGIVSLYKVDKGQPHEALSRPGKISEILGSELLIYTYPCCAEVLNIITPFSISTGEQIGVSHVFYSREDYNVIIHSINQDNQNGFKVNKDSKIRYSGSEFDRPMISYCDGNISNIIGSLPMNQEGKIVKASNCKSWVLARIDSMQTSKGYCVDEYYQRLINFEEYILYGWININDVEIE
jgi:hypothetical protein